MQVELPLSIPVLVAGLRVVVVTNIAMVSVGSVIGIGGLGAWFTAGYQTNKSDQIVAGIIVSAVGDEVALAHPSGHADLKAVWSIIGGPLLFLIGTILFKQTIHGRLQLSHLAGIGALAALLPVAHVLSPLMLAAATSFILIVVAIWEARSIGDKPTLETA